MAAGGTLCRSAYVSRLRRAFLLRVHPDRFRVHDDNAQSPPPVQQQRRSDEDSAPVSEAPVVRMKEQAVLVQALVERLGNPDFLEYSSSSTRGGGDDRQRNAFFRPSSSSGGAKGSSHFPYSIERSDGSISKHSIRLDSNPRTVLKDMAASIDFPPPPPLPVENSPSNGVGVDPDLLHRIHWVGNDARSGYAFEQQQQQRRQRQRPSPSSRSRNLRHFLQRTFNPADVAERKLHRLNASSAALAVRRAYRFASVDGTKLGWSSSSLSVLLQRLTSFRDEYRDELQVESFYPLRLFFGADEVSVPLDLYGGTVRLHPAATPLQWLATLSSVTEEKLEELRRRRECLAVNLKEVQNGALGGRVCVMRGHSCDPREFHECLERLAEEWRAECLRNGAEAAAAAESTPSSSSSQVTSRRPVSLAMESEQVVRRAEVRPDGSFRVPAGITTCLRDIRAALLRHASRSNELAEKEAKNAARCRVEMERARNVLGLAGVRRTGAIVTKEQMSDCLVRLLEWQLCTREGEDSWYDAEEGDGEEMRRRLMGQNLGIAGRGRPCHLGDDGSIVIPLDFC